MQQIGKQESPKVERTLLRPREIVESTGLSRVTVYGLISRGEIPSIKIGRAIRIPAEAFQEWIRRKSIGAGVG